MIENKEEEGNENGFGGRRREGRNGRKEWKEGKERVLVGYIEQEQEEGMQLWDRSKTKVKRGKLSDDEGNVNKY